MENIKKIDVEKIKQYLSKVKSKLSKIKKIHVITALVIIVAGSIGFFYGKNAWKKYTITKGAQKIITRISQSQQEIKEKTGKYTNNIFEDGSVAAELDLSQDIDTRQSNYATSGRRGRTTVRTIPTEQDDEEFSPFRTQRVKKISAEDPNVAQSGDYYVEIDADNGCMIVKYKRFTPEKTIFYAFFKDAKPLCRGRNCKEETNTEDADLCYVNGMCFPRRLKYETEQSCGDGHGKQTRNCSKTCDGGQCEEWGECVCEKGYGWDGKTCKQLQTEKDCNRQQCFNGVYCDYPDILEKTIENGTCKRKTTCQPNKGWQYTDWDCTCDKKYLCPLKDECVAMPRNLDSLELPDGQGNCLSITHRCDRGNGWKQLAGICHCNKVGTFWDRKLGEAKCSPCTQKPENAEFDSNAEFTDSCSWHCLPGFNHRKNDCTKPDGQYLCARTNIQSCTDEFSKHRKMKVDTPPNEGQPCYTDMKDHILFFDKKYQICTICQCVINVDKKNK